MTKLQVFTALAVGGLIGYVTYDQVHPPPRVTSINRLPASATLEFEGEPEPGYLTKMVLGVEVAPLLLERLFCIPDDDPLNPTIRIIRSSCWMTTSNTCKTGTVIISGELLGGGSELDFTIDHKDDSIALICIEKNTIREVSRTNGG